jgi:hypothetical protein
MSAAGAAPVVAVIIVADRTRHDRTNVRFGDGDGLPRRRTSATAFSIVGVRG